MSAVLPSIIVLMITALIVFRREIVIWVRDEGFEADTRRRR